jgi:2-polyprenyl-6-methoxyphenol hydroxylase-like FAD-dependent oxidoreductase
LESLVLLAIASSPLQAQSATHAHANANPKPTRLTDALMTDLLDPLRSLVAERADAKSFGPITLLGDAAHPMYPIGSNGASQAILDARVLTGCLRHYRDDLERGLARYEAIRRPATSAIVFANRQQGPEAGMQLVEDRAPDGFARLHDVVSEQELQQIADKYKQVAGFAVAALNDRPSLAEPTP